MIKKYAALFFCAFAFSCGPAPAHAGNALAFTDLRKGVVEVINGDHIGSGVVVGKDRVLTAAHVVDDKTTVMVAMRDSIMDIVGTVVKKDKDQDWALIRVPTGTIIPMPLNCEMPVYGEALAMIGFPLGLPFVITQGHVASDELGQLNNKSTGEFIVVDIRMNHGNSGGPLFDSKGAVIGIAAAVIPGSKDEGGDGVGVMSPLFKFCKELK